MMDEQYALFRGVIEKEFILLKRYWINTVAGLIVTYTMFAMVFFGGRAAAPGAIGESLPAVIVGFFLWSMAFAAFQDPIRLLQAEAQWGTLEQLYMTPLRLRAVIAYRTVATLIFSTITGLALLACMMVTTGRYLVVDFLTVIPLAIVTILAAIGLGYAFGGLALLYKRISNITLLVQFGLFAVLLAPSEPYALNLLPLTLGFDLLNESMQEGLRLWELPTIDLIAIVAVGVGYTGVGILILRYSIRVARTRGVMGDY